MDARSDWSAVMAATQNNSLFGESRLVELKIPGGKPGKAGGDMLVKLADLAGRGGLDGVLLLVSRPRLDTTSRNSKWPTSLAGAGLFFPIPARARGDIPTT